MQLMAKTPPIDEEAVFQAACRISDTRARDAYLENACGGNAGLRADVEALLAAQDHRGILDLQSVQLDTSAPDCRATEPAGTRIGRYKLLELVGEGGFGTVYRAEQQEPVRRQVALKIIKLGMDTKQVIARFEAERQALALMDHPNIAKVFDAGATDTGRPYFVMELVRGVSIAEHCDHAELSVRKRLELFVDVCRAIQHAHQQGIIHRDIKPTNVIVSLHDGKPVPKMIDFGIAKAIEHGVTKETLLTVQGQLIGTPQYMSPEQAEFGHADVDTRTDIYALGALLYELLTGTPPIVPEQLRHAGYDEVCRIIRETDPPAPSRRFSACKDTATRIAGRCQVRPTELRKLLRGDLDRIAMKALAKDRRDRYVTAEDLANDVQRHLEDKPIHARKASLVDRLSKWSRRHRLVVLAGAAVLIVMVVALLATTVITARAYERETLQRRLAQQEADRARTS
ncbi:MAG: serine/threonine protein kinase, partial [Pirellulales bacterium]